MLHWLQVLSLIVIAACSTKQPTVAPGYETPKVSHITFTAPCTECHEGVRPAPTENVAHGLGAVCSDCHNTSDAKAGWKPAKAFSHKPDPKACLGCHAQKRPALPHPAKGDCVSCHKYPKWPPGG